MFEASYTDSTAVELWISFDFPGDHAVVAGEYGALIGQLPKLLRSPNFQQFTLTVSDDRIAAGGVGWGGP